MRAKVEDSQSKLEAATGGNGLVLSQDSTTVGEDRLKCSAVRACACAGGPDGEGG